MTILNPENYRGQLGTHGSDAQLNTDKVFVVNGEIHKADGNFVSNFFISQVDENLFVGPYPQTDKDAYDLMKQKIEIVLNIMTESEKVNRNVDTKHLLKNY